MAKMKPKRRPRVHYGLENGLRFYELKRIRGLLSLMRKRLDEGRSSISVSEWSRLSSSFNELQEAINRICVARNLKGCIKDGNRVVFEAQT